MPLATLSPFLPTLHNNLVQALRMLLGVPAAISLRIRDQAPMLESGLRLAVVIGADQPLTLRLIDQANGRLWWRCDAFAVEHAGVAAASDRDLLAAILKRLNHMRDTPTEPVLATAVTALNVWRQWRAVPEGELLTVNEREVLIRLLFRCNQDCSFCWQDRDWPTLPLEVVTLWIQQAKAQGVTRLTLSGGEPTLHPDLPALMRMATGLGLAVSLQTNAIRLGQSLQLLTELQACGLRSVAISYHSPDAARSDAMTNAPTTHRKTEAGIAACLKAGVRVTLNCVIDLRNMAELPVHAAAILHRFGPLMRKFGDLSVSYSHPTAAFDEEEYRKNLAPLDLVQPLLTVALRMLNDSGVFATATGDCGFPLCVLRQVPEFIPRRSHTDRRQGRSSSAICQNCALIDSCVGPRTTYAAAVGERGLVPFAESPATIGSKVPHSTEAWWS